MNRPTPVSSFSVSAVAMCLLAAAWLASTAPSQALLLHDNDPVRVVVSDPTLYRVIEKVVIGPDPSEARRGLRTAIPPRTRLLGADTNAGVATITLGKRFLLVVRRPAQLELALEQLNKSSINAVAGLHTIQIRVEQIDGSIETLERVLGDAQGPAVAPDEIGARNRLFATGTGPGIPGALSGRVIAVSPGHGFYWHTSLGWTTQRGLIDGLIEDIHTNEIAMRYLIPYLENMGAAVISCRERGEDTSTDAVVDNDGGLPAYAETGGWSTSASSGYNGGGYRFATTGASTNATASWTLPVVRDGLHPVYAWFRASSNRPDDARYEIHHSGGVDVVSLDQTRDNLTWVPLGTFHFTAADGARVVLTNASNDIGKSIIADAIRVGAGVGSIASGAGTSGKPRWQEASRYWAQFNGAPSSVWNSIGGGQDNDDDVTCRPRFAEWRGADAFVSLHTNAGGGTGTNSFIYNGTPTAGSSTLQTAVHTQIISDIRATYDAGWTDRGRLTANFGEVRLLSSMPGMLIELAFHDTPGSADHLALHDPVFRRIGGRAIARGLLRYFVPGAAFAPEPPSLLSVRQDGSGGLAVNWTSVPGATHYTIEQSSNGKGFAEVATVVGAPTWSTGALPFGTVLSFRVRAWNSTGRSFPTEVLTAGTSHKPVAELLIVQGFDRLDRAVKGPDNTMDYVALHADAIRRSGEFSLAFDAATNQAVRGSLVSLPDYRAVDWLLGEESTQHDTFDAVEQFFVANYLGAGGRLLVTGAEIGWDLEAQGSGGDTTFYRNLLGADYIADDAGTYSFRGRAGGIFADIPFAAFDDGTHGTYNVDFPDVIGASDGNSTVCMEYATGAGAGIQRIVGDSRVVNLGFPLETIVDPDVRANVMTRALRFLLDGRALEVPARVQLGTTAPIGVHLPGWAGSVYALGAALGTGPIPLPNGQVLAMDPDGLFAATIGQSSSVFPGFGGVLDASGDASAGFAMPVDPSLVGARLVISGLTLVSVPGFGWGETLPWYRIRIE